MSIDCGGDSCSYPISLIQSTYVTLIPEFEVLVAACIIKFDEIKNNYVGLDYSPQIWTELDKCGEDLHKIFDPHMENFATIFGTNATELVFGVSNSPFIEPVNKFEYPYNCVLENLRKLSIDLNAIAQKAFDHATEILAKAG